MTFGFNFGFSKNRGGGGFNLFQYDENTLFFDFETGTGNVTEATGSDTISYAPDQIFGVNALQQPTKDYQGLIGTDGLNFNNTTARHMLFGFPNGITNGADGFYIAFNAKFDTISSTVIYSLRNASSSTPRIWVDFTGSRDIRARSSISDSGTSTTLGQTPVASRLTLGTWYTVELRLIADGVTTNPFDIWLNGTEQTLTLEYTSAFATFPATPPLNCFLFNVNTLNDSFDGEIQNLVFHNGAPSTAIRDSVSTYLNSIRPA